MRALFRSWRVAFSAVALLAAGALGLSAWLFTHTEDNAYNRSEAIRDGQVENCQVLGEPLRMAVIGLINEQIEASKRVDAEFFPNVPPAELKRLVRDANEARREIKRPLTHAPSCEDRYPPLPKP